MKQNKNSRRKFVKNLTKGALAAGAFPILLKDTPKEEVLEWSAKDFSANDNIQLGVIGLGIQGFSNIQAALGVPGVKLVAGCDLYDGRLVRVKERFGDDLFVTKSYSELLDRPDVDAVVIAVTDHWHDKIAIEAMEKGKAVYCEKPMVHHLDEGQAMIDKQKETGAVFQVGSQRVSSIAYLKAKELFEQGAIGQLVLADIRYDRQSALGAWQYSIPLDASTETIDWNNYIGDAPDHPFDPLHFFRWRNYRAYGTGVAGDLFVHLFSGLHLITSSIGPERIMATGGLRYWDDGRDVPDVMLGIYDYPKTSNHPAFNVQMRVNFIDGSGGGSHIKLIGSEGVMEIYGNNIKLTKSKVNPNPGYGGWDSYTTFSSDMQAKFKAWYEEKYPDIKTMVEPEELDYKSPAGYSDHVDHHRNFYHSIRTGAKVIEDAEFGMRAAGAALACNESYFNGKIIQWDPKKMKAVTA